MPSRKFVRFAHLVHATAHVLIPLTIFVPIFVRLEAQPVSCVSGPQVALSCCISRLSADTHGTMTR